MNIFVFKKSIFAMRCKQSITRCSRGFIIVIKTSK